MYDCWKSIMMIKILEWLLCICRKIFIHAPNHSFIEDLDICSIIDNEHVRIYKSIQKKLK